MLNANNSVAAAASEMLIRVKLSWSQGGNQVEVTGSWDNWTTREELHRDTQGYGFSVIKDLPPGQYRYLFVVDGLFRCAPDSPWSHASGTPFNVLDLQEYDSELPQHLSEFAAPQSPPSSYSNEFFSEDDYSRPPPEVPPQLQSIGLGEASTSEGQMPLPEPQQLNHLYIQNHVQGRCIALLSTRRFRQKFVAMVLYKPI